MRAHQEHFEQVGIEALGCRGVGAGVRVSGSGSGSGWGRGRGQGKREAGEGSWVAPRWQPASPGLACGDMAGILPAHVEHSAGTPEASNGTNKQHIRVAGGVATIGWGKGVHLQPESFEQVGGSNREGRGDQPATQHRVSRAPGASCNSRPTAAVRRCQLHHFRAIVLPPPPQKKRHRMHTCPQTRPPPFTVTHPTGPQRGAGGDAAHGGGRAAQAGGEGAAHGAGARAAGARARRAPEGRGQRLLARVPFGHCQHRL